MEPAKVFFTNLRTNPNSSLPDKLERLVRRAGFADLPIKDNFVA